MSDGRGSRHDTTFEMPRPLAFPASCRPQTQRCIQLARLRPLTSRLSSHCCGGPTSPEADRPNSSPFHTGARTLVPGLLSLAAGPVPLSSRLLVRFGSHSHASHAPHTGNSSQQQQAVQHTHRPTARWRNAGLCQARVLSHSIAGAWRPKGKTQSLCLLDSATSCRCSLCCWLAADCFVQNAAS